MFQRICFCLLLLACLLIAPSGVSGRWATSALAKDSQNQSSNRQAPHAEPEVDYGSYMADLQRQIKRNWFPPKGNESESVTVAFNMHKDGSVSDLKLKKASLIAAANKAALDALKDGAPYQVLPPGAPELVAIEFSFDYNVYKKGKMHDRTKSASAEGSAFASSVGVAVKNPLFWLALVALPILSLLVFGVIVYFTMRSRG